MRTILLILALLPGAALASSETACPASLPAETLQVRAPDGWTGYSPSILRLSGAGMMAGPPQSMTYLVPDKSARTKWGSVTTWSFAGQTEKWLYCFYSGSSSIQISRRLDTNATVCSIRFENSKLGGIDGAVATCSKR